MSFQVSFFYLDSLIPQVVYGVEGDDGNADADQIVSLCDELVSGGASLILSLDFTFGEGTSMFVLDLS